MILSYHNIAEQKGFYTIPFGVFQEQVNYIKKHYQVVSLDEYVVHLEKTRSSGNLAAITFDDAYTSYADLVVPFLKRLNIPSAVFVCTNYLGKSNEWDEPVNRFPIMGEQTLKNISANNLVTIGAHTVSHRSLASLPEDELNTELTQSKKIIESIIGKEVDYVAYPYGQLFLNVNSKVFTASQKAGYRAGVTTNFNTRNSAINLFALNRLDITPDDDLEKFKAKLQPKNYYYFKQKIKNLYNFLKNR